MCVCDMSSRSRVKQSRQFMSAGLSMRESRELETLKQNEVAYKSRIRSLEMELDTLKYRLDSLRKAKNTTIVRREREHIRMSTPKLGRRHSALSSPLSTQPSTVSLHETTPTGTICHHGDLPTQLEELRKQVGCLDRELLSERASYDKHYEELVTRHTREMNVLREKSQVEISELGEKMKRMQQERDEETRAAVCAECTSLRGECEGVKRECTQLTEKLEEMLAMNEKLRDSNLLLQGKCETLLEDLSFKEAKWTEREEALKAEIKKQWGQRYHEWIVKAEKKMEELQQVNTLLQGILRTKAHNPDL